ncbi:MAG: hypothetical protein ACYTFG_22380 [Planctomycetota bacterium]|jgi:hypothetical protein
MTAFVGKLGRLSAIAVLILMGSLSCLPADAGEGGDTPDPGWGKVDDWLVKDPEKPKNTGRKPPKQIKSAETMVPMPASGSIFMSQNERKKPPPPEYLMGKVHWGGMNDIPGMGELQDWNLAAGDVRKRSDTI